MKGQNQLEFFTGNGCGLCKNSVPVIGLFSLIVKQAAWLNRVPSGIDNKDRDHQG